MPVYKGRFAAKIDGDFVVFLIGMRVNHIFLLHKWLPVAFAMPRMLRELAKQPHLGLLHAQTSISGRTISVVQYWRSYDLLHSFAHARNSEHLPAWTTFNRKVGGNGAVGIFHESYLVRAEQYECVYANMPPYGLAVAGEMVPAVGRMRDARSRLEGMPERENLEKSSTQTV